MALERVHGEARTAELLAELITLPHRAWTVADDVQLLLALWWSRAKPGASMAKAQVTHLPESNSNSVYYTVYVSVDMRETCCNYAYVAVANKNRLCELCTTYG